MRRIYTAIYEKHGKWYVGYVEEIPGVNTQGRTLAEVRRNLREALDLVLETNRMLAIASLRSPKVIRETLAVSQ